MSDLLAARAQMAMSLGFHIIFAVVGMSMPLLMSIAEWMWLRTGNPMYKQLAERWSKGTAIFFAVGAVSGTVLSFELGLLWPQFMAFAGPIIGMPFSLEGFAFFLEAIFLGIYLYGWTRVSPRVHLFSGIMVAICGTLSGIFVVTVNSWMNTPAGFERDGNRVLSVDVWNAMWNPAATAQAIHMVLAAYITVSIAVAGIHAHLLRKCPQNETHRAAYRISLLVLCITLPLQMVSGDYCAKTVAKTQPVKLAAMEGHFETEAGASLNLLGIPNELTLETKYAIKIPYLLSVLSFGDPKAVVQGLEDFPRHNWPPVLVTHVAFQVMIFSGTALLILLFVGAILARRHRAFPEQGWYLIWVTYSAPMGLIALEAGWTVTEVGRQPWIIQGIMRTSEAVTPMPLLIVPFTLFSLIYLFLGIATLLLLQRQIQK